MSRLVSDTKQTVKFKVTQGQVNILNSYAETSPIAGGI